MRLELLPMAYNLTLESGTIVRRAHDEHTSALGTGQVLVAAAGLLALGGLVWLQAFLARRFRRVFNPALLVATAIAGMYALTGFTVLGGRRPPAGGQAGGFDSVLALARARAVGNSMHGDQSRYLLDPERADTYEQTYLDKSQSVLYAPSGNLGAYYTAVAEGWPPIPPRPSSWASSGRRRPAPARPPARRPSPTCSGGTGSSSRATPSCAGRPHARPCRFWWDSWRRGSRRTTPPW
nr:hypothetical protein GCM10020093_000610 [Planobispora longispora]